MRNKNIFIRKESAFSVVHGNGLPVFGNVVAFDEGENVHYSVDYPEPTKGGWRWHYADQEYAGQRTRSGTYVKPLDEFLKSFMPDLWDEYASFL